MQILGVRYLDDEGIRIIKLEMSKNRLSPDFFVGPEGYKSQNFERHILHLNSCSFTKAEITKMYFFLVKRNNLEKPVNLSLR